MTDQRSEARLEELVSTVLSERRPAGGAPDELRERVAGIPEQATMPVVGRLTAAPSARPILAGLAVAAVLALVFASGVVVQVAIPGVGSPVVPPTPALNPEVEGMGIVRSVQLALPVVIAILAASTLAMTGLVVGGRRRLGLLVIAGVIAAASFWIGNHAPPVFGFGMAPTLGLDLKAEPPAGSDGPGVYYVTAGPGEPFVVLISIRNQGPLPIRLEGLIEDPQPPDGSTRWTALWLQPDGASGGMTSDASPFVPSEIPPDGYLGLFVVWRAGSCAHGPGLTLDDLENSGMVVFDRVTLAYSVLGWPAQTDLELPFRIAVPGRPGENGCAN